MRGGFFWFGLLFFCCGGGDDVVLWCFVVFFLFLFYVDSRQRGCIISGMNERGERSECVLWFLLI